MWTIWAKLISGFDQPFNIANFVDDASETLINFKGFDSPSSQPTLLIPGFNQPFIRIKCVEDTSEAKLNLKMKKRELISGSNPISPS
jgi:hypothetical protein